MDKLKQVIEQKDSKHAAGIAYIVDDELLCVRSISGRWGIPKGHRHIDESPEDGAHREFTEETQIILNRPIKLSHIGKKKNGGDFHVFICQGDKKMTPRIGHEHIDWGYFRLFDLPKPFDDRVSKINDNLFENFIVERIDYLDTAQQLVKHYKLKSKVKFTTGANMADYDWVTDTINLRPNYPSVKEFLITVLHEIKHALDRKKMGAKRYERYYAMAGEMAVQKGGDFHDDNKFEEIAEKWGRREYRKWRNKIKENVFESSSNTGGYKADAGEPESGFIAAGLPRILGVSDNKPEPWFEKGGYTQEDFPQADTIYDEKDKKTPIYQVIKKIANTEEKYDTFQKDVAGWDKYGDKDYSTQFEE